MTDHPPSDPKQAIETLLENIEAIGVEEKALISQLDTMSEQAKSLFNQTGQVRKDLLSLKQELQLNKPAPVVEKTPEPAPAKAPAVSTPEPVTTPAPAYKPASYEPIHEDIPLSLHSLTPDKHEWELTLGIKWFSRIGIIALLIGVALGLNCAMPYVSSEVKLMLGGLSALGLFALGTKLHEKMTLLGRVLQAGGLCLGYVSLFAMFFFPGIATIHNDVAGYITLGSYVTVMMAVSHGIRSQTAALLSLGFGYYTASFCGHYEIAFIATTLLSLAALGLSYLNQEWRWVSRACVLGYLGTVLYWMNRPYHWYLPAPMHQDTPQAWITAYLWTNMILFHIASLLPHRREDALLNIFNSLGFYRTVALVTVNPLSHGLMEAILCLIQMASVAIFRIRPDKTHTSHLYTSFLWLGLGYLGLATCAYFAQTTQAMVLALEALVIGLASRVPGSSKHLKLASLLFWLYGAISCLALGFSHMGNGVDMPVVFSAFAIALVGFINDVFVYEKWDAGVRAMLLGLTNLVVLQTVWVEVPSHWITVTQTLTGLVLLTLGFVASLKKHRLMGLCWLALAVLHLIFVDVASLAPVYKVVMFLVFGAGLLAASFGYNLLAQKDAEAK